ncbi:HAMP domain-containing sensor histidine kinase [Tissierella praeacuta]|uniref:sensor histidine kinase n=1 Tax=Tissierella praeacuta TaxID=43131 RepID=UPI00333FCDD7
MIYLLWIFSLIFIYLIMKRKQKKRIDEILYLIDRLNHQNYSIPMKQDYFTILEDQIYKLFLRIVEEKEQIKKLSGIQIENLENISHQIKTPITTMLFDLEMLEKDEKNSEEIEKSITQLNRLNSLTEILLKLSSLDAQIENMQCEPILVEEIFDYALEILEEDIDRKDIKITKNYNGESIHVDFYWMSEAIINILKNAINLSECSLIKIKSIDNPIFTNIFIEDNGGGIKEDYIDKVFQRFYKTPDSNGFGIGLSMAKTVIENNNGEIKVENGKKGAIFNIKIYKAN